MIEQTLKEMTRKKMVKNLDLVQLIENKLKNTMFEITCDSKDEKSIILYSDFSIIRLFTDEKFITISFHASIRSDVAYVVFLKLKEIESIKRVDIVPAFYYDEKEAKVYYGNEAEEKLVNKLRRSFINEFVNEQTQIVILKNFRSPYIC